MIFTVFSFIFFLTAILSFFISYLVWKRKKVHGAVEISYLMFSTCIYAFFIAFETASTTIENKFFWAKLAYIGGAAVPVLYFIFIMRFTGHDKAITLRNRILLFIIPVITLIICATNEKHHLLWTGTSSISPETNLMLYYHGIWFWTGYMAYDYLLLVISTYYLFKYIYSYKKTFRKQGLVVLTGGLLPWMAGILYVTNWNPVPGMDIAPASTMLSGILLIYAMLHVGFLDLIPIARETLVETLKDGIIALDAKDRVQDVNGAACAYLGFPNTRLLGMPLDSSNVSDPLLANALLSPESPVQYELKSEGNIKTLRISKQKIKNQPGSRLLVIQDESDQIAKEREIRAGEERYRKTYNLFRLMVDNMSDMLWAKDLDNNYIFVNKAICDDLLKAVDTDEPIGKSDFFFKQREQRNHPDSADWHNMPLVCHNSDERIILTGVPEHFEESGKVGGKDTVMDVRKAPIYDEQGNMIGVVGSARDVTMQKKIMTEINKRDHLLEAITKATSLLVSGEKVEDHIHDCLDLIGKATEISRIFIFRINFAREEHNLIPRQVYEWTDDQSHTLVTDRNMPEIPLGRYFPEWSDRIVHGKVCVGKTRELGRRERTFLESRQVKSILILPVSFEEKIWGFIVYEDCVKERDWTPVEKQLLTTASHTIGSVYVRKRNQEELIEAKEKAEENDRLKSAFLANMSHEIRTPMNSILGFVSLLQEPDLTKEEKKEYLNIVKKGGERLLNTLRDIIDISFIETRQVSIHYGVLDINEMNQFFYDYFKEDAENKGLSFPMPLPVPDEESLIKTDKNKVYSVMSNIIKNALKYTHTGSIEFGCFLHPDKVEFYVKDTGIGIPENMHQTIFERFIQADVSSTRIYEGSGLGLSISKAYVEMLGGKIRVESELKKGSTFYFEIPQFHQKVRSAVSVSGRTEKSLPQRLTPLNIMVVEDDSANFEYINVILKKMNHKVWHTITGTEAVELCRRKACFDLILMDIKLPDLGGCETTRRIRLFDQVTPIIALSAFALKEDREKAIAAGCNEYLIKPLNKEMLLVILERFSGNNQ